LAANPNFGELVATTLNLWANKEFANAVTGHNPLFFRLRKNGNVQTGGLGVKALEPVMYLDTTNGFQVTAVQSAYNATSPYLAQGWSNAEYQWAEKLMYVTLPSSILDKQGSETQKLNYLSAYKDLAMKSFLEALNLDLWRAENAVGSDGSSTQFLCSIRTLLNRGGSNTTSSSSGSQYLPQQIGTAVGTSPITNVGNIERNAAGNAFWCTPITNPATTDTISLGMFQNQVSLATRDSDYPDLIITTRQNWNDLASILMGLQRYESGGLADAGFKQSLKFDGMDVIFDDNVPAKNMFVINTKYLKLRCNTMAPKFVYKPDPYRPVENWEARWMGQITSGNLGRVMARHSNLGN